MEDRVFMLVPRWEYRRESDLTIEELNEIGQEGWELAGYAVAGDLPIRRFTSSNGQSMTHQKANRWKNLTDNYLI